MTSPRIMILALVGGSLLLTGCNNDKKDQQALLLEENKALRQQLAEVQESADQERRSSAMREAELEKQLMNRDEELARPFEGIPGVTGSVSGGAVVATVSGDVLFDSGRDTLKNSAKSSLSKIAKVIKNAYPGMQIRVAGHTDSDPIKKSNYKSNYHLGFARAWAVREYLIKQGLPAKDVSLASYGPDKPGSNKSKSRRVDVAVMLDG